MKSSYLIVFVLIAFITFFIFREKIASNLKKLTLSFEHEKLLMQLHPSARHYIKEFIADVEQQTGYDVYITSTYRSFEKQNNLMLGGHTSTSAGNSFHNYGMGIDLNLVKNDVWVKMATPKQVWLDTGIVEIANNYNLRWGGNFGRYDPVHFDMGNHFSMTDLQDLAFEQYGSDVNKVKGNKLNVNSLI